MENSTDNPSPRKETRLTRLFDNALANLLGQIAFVCMLLLFGYISHDLFQPQTSIPATQAAKPLVPPEAPTTSPSALTYTIPIFAIAVCVYLLVILHFGSLESFLFWHTREIKAGFSVVLIVGIIILVVYLIQLTIPDGIVIEL